MDSCVPTHSSTESAPTCAQNVGSRKQTRDQIVRRNILCCHQGAIRERYAQKAGLRTGHELALHASRLIPVLADGASVVGRCERADYELPGSDVADGLADFLNYAAVLVIHGCGLSYRLDTAIGPQVRSANTCCREADDGIRRPGDLGGFALLEADVA